jgi:sulfoxide reductase heme-binding subunit YedZ
MSASQQHTPPSAAPGSQAVYPPAAPARPRPGWLPEFRFTPVQIAAHAAAWVPAILIGVDYLRNNWTVNPIQYLTFRTGWAAITLLVASLACTPLNTLFSFKEALKIRRPLGLYAFLYAFVHFLIFVAVDYGLDLNLIYEAIFEKRYALVGFAALLILLPMALTSTRGWQRRLGKNWKRLHRLVYLAAVLAVVHYIWLVKADIRKPLVYAALVAALLLARTPGVRKALIHTRNRVLARLRKRDDTLQERK